MISPDRITCCRIAGITGDDPRSVKRVLLGLTCHAGTKARVLDAMQVLGLGPLPVPVSSPVTVAEAR